MGFRTCGRQPSVIPTVCPTLPTSRLKPKFRTFQGRRSVIRILSYLRYRACFGQQRGHLFQSGEPIRSFLIEAAKRSI